MAIGDSVQQPRGYKLALFDPRLAIGLQTLGFLWFAGFSAMVGIRTAGSPWLGTLAAYGPYFTSLLITCISRRCLLQGDELIIGDGKTAKSIWLSRLKVEFNRAGNRLIIRPAEGGQTKVHGFRLKDAERLAQALVAAGVEVTGVSGQPLVPLSNDIKIQSPLTDSVNWRWQDCQTPDLALDAVIGSTDTQTIQITDQRVCLLRKEREVASFDLKAITLVRQYKRDELETARLVLKHGKRHLWPLTDWDSPVEMEIQIALRTRGVPLEEEAWVRRQEALLG